VATEINLKENIIKGEMANRINLFEKAHPEIDLGWFNDLIGDIITITIEYINQGGENE